MANNIVAPGVGTTLATEEIAGAHMSRVKLAIGALGADSGDVSAANPLPVTAASNLPVAVAAALPAGTNNIGDVDVLSLPSLPAGANVIGTVGVNALPSLPAGNNNIGDVDVASLPATPAGTNLIGRVAAGPDLANFYNGAAAAAVSRVNTVLTATNNTVFTPASTKKARLVSLTLIPLGAAMTVYLQTSGSNQISNSTNPIPLDKTGATGLQGLLLPYNPMGYLEGAADEAVTVVCSSTAPVLFLAQFAAM